MVRYNLRDILCLQTLAPISAGVVFAAESFSGKVVHYFDVIDSISSAIGWPLYENHNQVFFTVSALEGIMYGGLLLLVMLSLLLLRHRWATLLAFSMPFGILLLQFLRFWMTVVPMNAETALTIAKWTMIPTLVAACLLFLGWCFMNRTTHRSGERTAFFQRPPWQRFAITATCVIYLSVSAYGWYGMVSFRTEMIETWRHLEEPEHQ